jgi:hypothetical protein
MCGSSKMKTRSKWQVHKHLTNKSIAQAKQCKWLMKLKRTLNYKFTLDSLHSRGLHLKRRYHLPPYNIFWTSLWKLHWNGFFFKTPKWESWNFQIISILIL